MLGHHSPDISVIFNVREQKVNWTSFDVTEEGTRPTIIVEVVSPDYRVNDVVTKVSHYHLAGVPFYFIVDHQEADDPAKLLGYRRAEEGFMPLAADGKGRFWLDSIGVWMGVEDGRVACYDGQTEERLGNYTEISEALEEMSERAEAEAKRAANALRRARTSARRAEVEKQRADREAVRADEERRQRIELEQQIQALKAEIALSHTNGRPK